MIVVVTKQFEKDVKKELSKSNQQQLAGILEKLQEANSIKEVSNIKKLKGYKSAYRARMGDYRIGFILEGNVIKLSRIMHRSEIYKYFP